MFSDVKIKTFDLADLVGRKLKVRSFSEKSTEIVVAVDMTTGDFFVLKEINHPMPAEDLAGR